MMRAEVVKRLEGIDPLKGRWNELALADRRDGFFRTYAWYSAWMRRIRNDAEPFVIVVRGDAGEIVGLAPLCRLAYRDHGIRLTALSSVGREVVSGDFLDYLSLPEHRPAVLAAIFDGMWEARSDWDILVAGELSEEGDLDEAVTNFAVKHNLPLRRQEERICPYIELPRTYDDYLASLSSTVRYKLRRDSRELLERRGGALRVYTDGDAACRLDVLIRLHLAHWQAIGQPGTLGRAGFREFLRDVCSAPPAGTSARLYTLEAQGNAIAALLVFWSGASALFYQSGWDPESPFTKLSPGMIIQGQAIRDAIEGGHAYYEFLRGDESYKSRLTKSTRKTATLLVARGLIAREYLRVSRWKDSVKNLVGAAAVKSL
jgi:CelD/BcsL family acetyltransferase involved in cellulose biosynthesis